MAKSQKGKYMQPLRRSMNGNDHALGDKIHDFHKS